MILGWAVPAPAQYQVQANGRLFEANPQVGAGGFNFTRPVSPLMSGNPFATGNVRGGMSLRSFSPISATTAFRSPLGSASLSNFVRDSVSVADMRSALFSGRIAAQPFYDPARTAPTVEFLRGQYGLDLQKPAGRTFSTSGVPDVTAPISGPLDLRLDSGRSLRAHMTGAPAAPTRPEESAIFGVNRLTQSPVKAASPSYLPQMWQLPATTPQSDTIETLADMTEHVAYLPRFARPLDFTPSDPSASDLPGSPLDMVLKGDTTGLLMGDQGIPQTRLAPPPPLPWQTATPPIRPTETTASAGSVDAPRLPVSPSLLPGNDLFTDMQFALALRTNPGAEWFADMKTAVRAGATTNLELQEMADLQAEDFISQIMDRPIATFVGKDASALNDELLRAEALLDIGRYYEAVARYEIANLIDPLNPLPLLGKGHALLAAGEYLPAAVALVRGLERFPELAIFAVDLEDLMGGGEIVDVRRADIMKRLTQREDAKLRFLLGYIEYHAGNRASGLQNLEKAAARAGPGSIIQRYPAMLQGGALPPPKLPISVPAEPGATPARPGGAGDPTPIPKP